MSSRSRPKPDLLGRARELARIDAAATGAREGRGATICLLGETGMGKTSLLAAAAERARDGGLDVAGAEERTVLELLARAERRPTALLADDAELLDPRSLEALGRLARQTLTAPTLLIFATRSGPTGGPAGLDELIASVPPERTIELKPLSPAHAAELVETLAGVELDSEEAAACGRLTGGVPLQARLLADELANRHRTADRVTKAELEAAALISIRRFLRRGTIDRRAIRLLAALALTGGSTGSDVAARAAQVDSESVSRLAAALASYGLVQNGARLEPADAIIGKAAAESLGEEERRNLHARIAGELGRRGAGPRAIAPHLFELEPGDDPTVAATLLRAAVDLNSAPECAIGYLRRALAEPPAAAERPRVILALGVALGRASDDDATGVLREAVELSENDLDLRTEAVRELALVLAREGKGLEAAALLEERIDQIATGPREAVLSLELEHAGLAPLSPALHARVRDRLQADRWDLKEGTPAERRLLSARAEYEAMAAGDAATATALVLEALRMAPLSDGGVRTLNAGRSIWLLLRAEQFTEAMLLIERRLREADGTAATADAAMFHAEAAYLQLQAGDMEAAEREAGKALVLAPTDSYRMPTEMAAAYRATALLEQDRLPEAVGVVQASPLGWEGPTPSADQAGTFGTAQLLIARGRLRIALGQDEEGLKDLLEVAAQKQRIGVANPAGFPWLGPAVEVLIARGERNRAEALVAEPLEGARKWNAPGALALTLAAAGRARRKPAEIEQAAAIAHEAAAPAVRAEVACTLALARGAREGGAGELVSATNLAAGCGMHRLARLTRELLSSRAQASNGLVDLTGRELEVVEMIVEGMTNAQIAAGLSISPRTVQVHVANAMRKSGAGNRTELAALALRRNPSR